MVVKVIANTATKEIYSENKSMKVSKKVTREHVEKIKQNIFTLR